MSKLDSIGERFNDLPETLRTLHKARFDWAKVLKLIADNSAALEEVLESYPVDLLPAGVLRRIEGEKPYLLLAEDTLVPRVSFQSNKSKRIDLAQQSAAATEVLFRVIPSKPEFIRIDTARGLTHVRTQTGFLLDSMENGKPVFAYIQGSAPRKVLTDTHLGSFLNGVGVLYAFRIPFKA